MAGRFGSGMAGAVVTGHLLYTEEDVELVARVLNGKLLFVPPAANSPYLDPLRESYRAEARRILDALSSANRLVPPGSEVREEWGTQRLTGEAVFEYDDREQAELYARETAAFPGQIMRRTHIVTPWVPEEGS